MLSNCQRPAGCARVERGACVPLMCMPGWALLPACFVAGQHRSALLCVLCAGSDVCCTGRITGRPACAAALCGRGRLGSLACLSHCTEHVRRVRSALHINMSQQGHNFLTVRGKHQQSGMWALSATVSARVVVWGQFTRLEGGRVPSPNV